MITVSGEGLYSPVDIRVDGHLHLHPGDRTGIRLTGHATFHPTSTIDPP